MTRVVEKLPEFDFINRGRNGWTSGDIAAKIETLDIPALTFIPFFWAQMIGGGVERWAH